MSQNGEVRVLNNGTDTGFDGQQDTTPEGAPSGKRNTHVHSRVQRHKPGRKRKNWMPNPFGKHPLSSAVKKYLTAIEQYYAPSTFEEKSRKLRMISKQMIALGAPQSPRQWDREHVRAFVKWMNDKGLDNATQRKYLRYLKDFIESYRNMVFVDMVAQKEIRMPPSPQKEVRSLPRDVIDLIHNATLTMEGWWGSISRLITVLYPYTGLRPSELRTLKYTDVDTANWLITVSHPKGEKSYGKKRVVGVLPHIRTDIANYLEERRTYLAEHGLPETVEPLIPAINKGKAGYWSGPRLRTLKKRIESLSGVQFKIKDYRASFCQIAIDLGADLPAVSKQMGHKTTQTTELYYGRIRDISAIKELERAFTEPNAQTLIHRELEQISR